MRRFLLFAITIVSFATIHADNVDKNTAFETAVSFMQKKNPAIRFNKNNGRKIVGKSTNNTQPYYVFNAESNQGFVIVSGDDQTEPIMGYAEEGSFDYDNIPPALQFMLDLYAEELDSLNQEEKQGNESTGNTGSNPKKVVSLPRTSIEPFCTRMWGHATPYSNLSPIYNGARCGIGCLPAAVAIAMGYFNWPQKTAEIPAYTTSTYSIRMDKLEPCELQWDNMLDGYDIPYTSAQAKAVAELMLYISQSMQADHGTGNAYISSAVNGLIKFFDYDPALHHVYSTDFDYINDFTHVVYNELHEGRPVLFDGFSLSTPLWNPAGHAFVCDGYEKDDMFHINWGWNGYCNGYFRLTMLNPYKTTRNRNYTKNLGALIGMQPKGWKETSTTSYTDEDLSLQFISITPNENNIRITLQNGNDAKLSFESAIALYDNDLNFVKLISNIDTTTFNKSGWNYKTYSSISYEGVNDGKFKVIPVSRICGEEKWHFSRSIGTYAYLEANVNEGKVSYSPVETIVVNSFSVLESDQGNGIGAPQTAILNVTNNSFVKYDKNIYLVANKQLNMIHGLRIPMNSTEEIQFEFVPYVAGNYTLEVCKDMDGDFPIASTTTTVSDQVNYGNESKNYRILSAEIIEDNANVSGNVGYVYTDKYKVSFKITNIDSLQTFNDFVRFSMSISKSTVSAWETSVLQHIRLAPKETKVFTFESNELSWTNKEYVYRIMTKWNSFASMDNVVDWSKKGTYQILATPYTIARANGVRYWTSNGNIQGQMRIDGDSFQVPEDVVAISFDNPDSSTWPTTIIPNSNPNTLYYFSGKGDYSYLNNVIYEGKADSIKFVDGYPALVPEDFKANNISYTRIFDKGCEGKKNTYNWSTIILPFDVQKVVNTTDSIDIDWFHNSEELNKDFWLCKYHGKENYELLFDYADEFKANTPYIIAVSGDERIDAPGIVGKPILFSSDNVDVKSGTLYQDTDDFDFEGTTTGTSINDNFIYILSDNGNGNSFEYADTEATITPFHAYFISDVSPNNYNKKLNILILHENREMTGIEDNYINKTQEHAVYDLSGRKVNKNQLQKGVYIINGKKWVYAK